MTGPAESGGATRFLFTRGCGWSSSWFVIGDGFHLRPPRHGQAAAWCWSPCRSYWAIGASMIVLAPAQRLGRASSGGRHRNRRPAQPARPIWPLSQQFDQGLPLWWHYMARWPSRRAVPAALRYPLLPWIGVMLLGLVSPAYSNAQRPLVRRNAATGGLGLMVALSCYAPRPLRRPEPLAGPAGRHHRHRHRLSHTQNTHRAWHSC